MEEDFDTVTFRDMRSGVTAQRILAGEQLTLRIGHHLIADIVPREPEQDVKPEEILAPEEAAAETTFFTKN